MSEAPGLPGSQARETIEGMEMTAVSRVTNEQFGEAVGCDYTMASRLRNGQRLPSRELLERIVNAYGLDGNEALRATAGGGESFARFLADHVFNPMSKSGSTADCSCRQPRPLVLPPLVEGSLDG